MKAFLKFTAALCLMFLCLGWEQTASAAFSDVPADHWAYGEIAAVESRGIVEGSDGQFRPGESVSNQAFLAMVCRASGMDDRTLESTWSASPIIAYGRHLGWFEDEELNLDNRSQPITRELAAKLLVKAFFPEEYRRDRKDAFVDSAVGEISDILHRNHGIKL